MRDAAEPGPQKAFRVPHTKQREKIEEREGSRGYGLQQFSAILSQWDQAWGGWTRPQLRYLHNVCNVRSVNLRGRETALARRGGVGTGTLFGNMLYHVLAGSKGGKKRGWASAVIAKHARAVHGRAKGVAIRQCAHPNFAA